MSTSPTVSLHPLRDRVHDPSGVDEEGPGLALLDEIDRPHEVLFRLLSEPFDALQEMLLGRRLQRVQIRDSELLPQDLDLLRPEAADPKQVEDARRELRPELLVVRDPTGGHVLRDLFGQGRPDAGNLVDPPRPYEVLHVLRERFELSRGPLVR